MFRKILSLFTNRWKCDIISCVWHTGKERNQNNMDLKDCRIEIDKINNEMLTLFIKRMRLSEQVAKYKAENGLPVFDSEREKQILDEMAQKADKEFEPYVREFYSALMAVSRSYQSEIIRSEKDI